MLTAQQIAEETGIASHTVRYRLVSLRRAGKVKFEQHGQVYVYTKPAIKEVENFDKKG